MNQHVLKRVKNEQHSPNPSIVESIMECYRNETIQELKKKYGFLMMSMDEIKNLMSLLSTSGIIYYSTYQQFISGGKSLITQEILPPSIFYQLPIFQDKEEIYILEEDLNTFITEFYYIHSLYGTIIDFCHQNQTAITKDELKQFIIFFTRSISITNVLTSQFLQFYYMHVTNSLFFFLCEEGQNSIPLDILLTSSDMRDYAIQSDCYKEYIKSWNEEQVKYYYKYNKGEQHCELPSNWYSPETAFMIYSQFLHLDEDQNGLITFEDLNSFNGGGLITLFTQSIIHSFGISQGLNYEGFLQFATAYYNLYRKASQRYYFTWIDKDNKGFLSVDIIRLYAIEITSIVGKSIKQYDPDRLVHLVYDALQIQQKTLIQLHSFQEAKHGSLVLSLLTDSNIFMNLIVDENGSPVN